MTNFAAFMEGNFFRSRSIKGYTPVGQLGILIACTVAGFILTSVLQVFILMTMMKGPLNLQDLQSTITAAMNNPENVNALRMMQVVGTFAIMFVPAVVFLWICYGKNWFWLGFNKYLKPMQLVAAFGLIFLANLCAQPLADLSKWIFSHMPVLDMKARGLEDLYNQQVQAMSNLRSPVEYVVAVIIMALLPAIFEEVFFRGVLQNLFERWTKNAWVAIILAALIFSLIHMSYYLFLSRAVLGFVLGLCYVLTRNIWVNIVAHFLNNAIAVTQLYFQKGKVDVNDMDIKIPWPLALVALAALVGIAIYLYRISAYQRQQVRAKAEILEAQNDPFDGFTQNYRDN